METALNTINGDQLLNFIQYDLLLNRTLDEPLSLKTDLIEGGIIDSLSLIQLVTYIEKELSIKVDDAEVIPDHFQTVWHIVEYIKKKVGQSD